MNVNKKVAVTSSVAFILVILGCRLGQSLGSKIVPTPIPTVPISTISPAASATPTLISTATSEPTITTSSIVLMTYPDHENCTIQVDTQEWKIGDLWKENIIGRENNVINGVVPVSNKFLVYLVEHQVYPGCKVAWSPGVGFEESTIQKSFETINDKNWEIWNIGNNGARVYFWTELRDIRFLQVPPTDMSQQQGCTEDIYIIIESLSCK